MIEPWNNSLLLPPPVNMFLCTKQFDISQLNHVCNSIIKILSKQSPLHKESALCSRFIYKYDRKFRNDIGYRNLRKVHTALKRYLSLNLLKDIESFLSALPSENDDEKYLPTRQMLEYVMLRIIAFSKIMLRICICSKQSAIFYLDRVKRGEGHWMSLLPYALMSRLWSMAMVLVQHSTTWYSNLYPYLNKLELKGLEFLPGNYVLPKDLDEWLDLKNIDNFGKFDWDQKKSFQMDKSLFEDDDDNDLFDNILNFVNQSNEIESDTELNERRTELNTLPSLKEEIGQILTRETNKNDQGTIVPREGLHRDKGEVLSRESFKVLLNTNNKDIHVNIHKYKEKSKAKHNKQTNQTMKNSQVSGHSADHVTSGTSLKKFIQMEESYRNESNNKMLTEHLSLMQWHALKNSLTNLCNELTNRKIERKFQKIWKEKCLDYK